MLTYPFSIKKKNNKKKTKKKNTVYLGMPRRTPHRK